MAKKKARAGKPAGQILQYGPLDFDPRLLRSTRQADPAYASWGASDAEASPSWPSRTLPRPPAPSCIISLGDSEYRLDGGPAVTVDSTEDAVLQAFLDGKHWKGRASLALGELRQRSRVNDAPRVLKRIARKYGWAAAVALPGGRGHGGYRVTVRRESAGAGPR
jgi:hypothetical protein